MENSEGMWSFNSCEDDAWYHGLFSTKEEALEEGKLYYEGVDFIFVGQATKENLSPHIDVGWVIDDISEQMYEQVGEVAENYLANVSESEYDELSSRLNAVLSDWINKYHRPNFYSIINIEKYWLNEDGSHYREQDINSD